MVFWELGGKCAKKKKKGRHQCWISSSTKEEYAWWVCVIYLKRKKNGKIFHSTAETYYASKMLLDSISFYFKGCSPLCRYCLQSPSFFVALMLYQAQGAVLMESYLIASIPLLLWHSSTKNCFEALSVSSVMQTDSSFNMISDT